MTIRDIMDKGLIMAASTADELWETATLLDATETAASR